MTCSKILRYEKRDRTAYITLNRPEVMNAINIELGQAIAAAVKNAEKDDDILVLIIIGEGGKAFSAGADLKEKNQRDVTEITNSWQDADANCTKPIIAAIDGHCIAGGLELALRCDIRVATQKSTFGLPEPRRSMLAGYGLHNLSRMIPLGEALLIQLTGSPITAERAYQIGLIQKLVPDRAALLQQADAIANDIVQCAPLAVQAIKRIVKTGRNVPPEYSLKLAEPIRKFIDSTEDRLEGPRSFVEKRAPKWKMR
ncbi:MAG: enoyl-CoA hydratase/isomerase family protein [Betaproteobacteria bacterium]|nr:enoyl-CoA hydratase/isomerase family protein [Betaproteobacteria bacterium]